MGPDAIPPDSSCSRMQKLWDSPCCQWTAANLLTSAQSPSDKARLLASTELTSGAWLKAVPLPSLGLKLDDDSVRIAVGLRLGVNICAAHECICGAKVDCQGTHDLACRFSAGRHSRHSMLNDIICRSLQRAQIPAVKEPNGLCRSDGKRPDGVTMIPWSRGRCMAWDVTVVDTLAPSHVTDSSSSAGSAAVKAEGIKTAKYASLAQTHVFIPLALETMGAWGQQCTDFVTDLGRRLTAVSGEKREPSFLRQRISMAVQRGNALACRGTLPTDSLTDHSSPTD